uniref:Uncharacterized protein n=1 Tax=Scleropages formosus TaxID=113540 RepID=A0A8C9REA4_SCLFO
MLPQQVDEEPRGPDPDDHPRALDFLRLSEALDGLEHDGEAERREEDGVHEGAHHLRPDPAERVLVGRLRLLGEAHRHQRHDQGDHVRQHVEGVRQHGQRRRDSADHHLHDKEAECQRQHEEQFSHGTRRFGDRHAPPLRHWSLGN